MPDEIADGDIPGSALMLPVPTLQDHPHLHAMTGTKSVADIPTAPEQNPQPEHHASIDHNINGDVKATVTTELVPSQAPDEGPESTADTHPLATMGSVGLRRSTRERRPSFKLRSAYSAQILDESEPTSYREALQHRHSHEWQTAMREEMDSLHLNQTWDLVDEDTLSRSGKRAIGYKWVFKLKHNADRSICFKARLVIKGYEQRYSIDFEETFAPVAKFVTVRTLFVLAAQYNWEIEQLDVKTAFLNPELHEEVYMEQPEGFITPSASGGKLFCRLKKCLYGLKQASRAWYKDIDGYLVGNLGLTRSLEDSNLYISVLANIIILLYVDDILQFSSSRNAINTIKSQLMKRYKMTDLGPHHNFSALSSPETRNLKHCIFIRVCTSNACSSDSKWINAMES